MTAAASLAAAFVAIVMVGGALKALFDWAQEDIRKAREADLNAAVKKIAARRGGHQIIPSAQWPKPYVKPSCYHYAVSPVRLVKTGELVAGICLDCNAEIGPELVPVRARAIRYVTDVQGMMIYSVETSRKRVESAIESGAFTINEKGL
jgi:hypothetical protein